MTELLKDKRAVASLDGAEGFGYLAGACRELGDFKRCQGLFREMRRRGVEPDAVCLDHAVGACRRTNTSASTALAFVREHYGRDGVARARMVALSGLLEIAAAQRDAAAAEEVAAAALSRGLGTEPLVCGAAAACLATLEGLGTAPSDTDGALARLAACEAATGRDGTKWKEALVLLEDLVRRDAAAIDLHGATTDAARAAVRAILADFERLQGQRGRGRGRGSGSASLLEGGAVAEVGAAEGGSVAASGTLEPQLFHSDGDGDGNGGSTSTSREKHTLAIITGRGKHTPGGESLVRQAVLEQLREAGYKRRLSLPPNNPGQLLLDLSETGGDEVEGEAGGKVGGEDGGGFGGEVGVEVGGEVGGGETMDGDGDRGEADNGHSHSHDGGGSGGGGGPGGGGGGDHAASMTPTRVGQDQGRGRGQGQNDQIQDYHPTLGQADLSTLLTRCYRKKDFDEGRYLGRWRMKLHWGWL